MNDYDIAREGLADAIEAAREEAVDPPRPQPILLDGCTCGGIGSTGSHRPGCIWSVR